MQHMLSVGFYIQRKRIDAKNEVPIIMRVKLLGGTRDISKCAILKWKRLSDVEYQARINLQAVDQLINPYTYLFDDADIERIAKEDPRRANQMRSMKIKNNPPLLDWYVLNDRKPIFEVHHKDYIAGALPWEHPDSWLITLCEDCHHLVHFGNDHEAPVVRKVYTDKSKRFELSLSSCSRCNGKGYIWEYRHIHGGICFGCGGAE